MKTTRIALVLLLGIMLLSGFACGGGNGEGGDVVNTPDPNLEAAIREAIEKPIGDIYESDLLGLAKLYASGRDITDLNGLEYCTNLIQLSLRNNQISDISPLSGLSSLTTLDIGDNQISDISPLSGLSSLTQLSLRDNQISDISPLSGLSSLTVLNLWINQISDISPLSGLASLTQLSLWDNQISDISPLSGLASLTQLSLWDNQISDIEPLVNNLGLSLGDSVDLGGNPLSTISIDTYIPQLEARGVIVKYPPNHP